MAKKDTMVAIVFETVRGEYCEFVTAYVIANEERGFHNFE